MKMEEVPLSKQFLSQNLIIHDVIRMIPIYAPRCSWVGPWTRCLCMSSMVSAAELHPQLQHKAFFKILIHEYNPQDNFYSNMLLTDSVMSKMRSYDIPHEHFFILSRTTATQVTSETFSPILIRTQKFIFIVFALYPLCTPIHSTSIQ